jgi:hypothetical protein
MVLSPMASCPARHEFVGFRTESFGWTGIRVRMIYAVNDNVVSTIQGLR